MPNYPNKEANNNSITPAWVRLQHISGIHAEQLWKQGAFGTGRYNHRTKRQDSFIAPEVIRENSDILGRGDESEIKNRLYWYILYYPDTHKASRE